MFKKLLLVVLSVITLQTVKAQTEKGSQNLGATFGIVTVNSNLNNFNNYDNSYTQAKTKQTSYSVVPNYSYFIADKLDIGVGVGYAYSKSEYNSDPNSAQEQNTKSFTSIISLRKYFLFDNKIGIRTGPFISYEKTKSNNIYVGRQDTWNSNIYSGGLVMDFVYYPAKNIGLAAGLANLRYSHQKLTGISEGTNKVFNFSFVDNLSLSVYYAFGK